MTTKSNSKKYRLSGLRQAREAVGLGVDELANRSGIAPAVIERAESGVPLKREAVLALGVGLSEPERIVDLGQLAEPHGIRFERVALPRCAELAKSVNLSSASLADAAGVGRSVIHTLESDEAVSRDHAERVYRALKAAGAAIEDAADALVPHRFMPNCESLRQRLHWRRSKLVAEAGVDMGSVERLERNQSAPANQVERIFDVLRGVHSERFGHHISTSEVCLDSSDLPFPPLFDIPTETAPKAAAPAATAHPGNPAEPETAHASDEPAVTAEPTDSSKVSEAGGVALEGADAAVAAQDEERTQVAEASAAESVPEVAVGETAEASGQAEVADSTATAEGPSPTDKTESH